MTPGEDAAGMGTNDRITATFSEGMATAAINADNFRLTDGTNPISGTVSFDAANHVAVFTPTGSLVPFTRYTATIVTGVKDLGGNPLMTDFAWCFATGGATDGTAPTVTSTIPANTVVSVFVNRNVTASFSEPMNSSSLTPVSFKVMAPGSVAVTGTVSYRGGTAIFSPAKDLAPNTLYTATIGTGTTDLAGNPLQSNESWEFTTGAAIDSAAPVVSSTSPANAASGVAIGTSIRVTFNEPVDPATVTTASFRLSGPGTDNVIGTVQYDSVTNTATFARIKHLTTPVSFHPTPVSNLDPNTTYTATLTTDITDLAGNPLATNAVLVFTTGP